MKKAIRIIILVIAICVFVFSLFMIISTRLKYKKAIDTYDKISADMVSITSSFTVPDLNDIKEKNEEGIMQVDSDIIPIELDTDEAEIYNPDIIGWIFCPDTTINYPVMQSKDNDYYLRRMADKKYNIAGSIFMDYRNKGDFSDINTIIYGHNMKNGTMFSDIMKYKDRSYYEAHKYIYYTSTDERSYIFKIIGSAVVSPDDAIFRTYYEPADLQRQLETYPSMLFEAGTDLSTIDHLVTLSTCSNDAGTMRYLLFCIPIEIINVSYSNLTK